jgi:phosphate-selective porin OprO/OprP
MTRDGINRSGGPLIKGGAMKKFMVAAAVMGSILHGQGVFAKTLEDVLTEKGIITEEDYKAVTENRPVTYKLGDGFTFTSEDGKYKESIGGFMQLQYAYTDLDNANDTNAKTVQDSSKFLMNRVKLYFNGYSLTPDLTYKLQLNLTQGNVLSTGKMIEEAYVNYRFIDEAQLRFGQDKVAFARQFIVSSAAQEFVDLSHVATAFAPGYDFGLMLHGKIAGGLVTYNTGVFGGLGQGTIQTTNDNAITARIAFNPLGDMKYVESDAEYSEKPLLSFGANYYVDTVKNNATTNLNIFSSTGWIGIGSPLMPANVKFGATEKLNINTGGFDGAFKWRGLYAQGEYFIGQADGQTSHNSLRSQGFYGQAGYFIIPKYLEVAARYAYLDPDRDVANDHWVESTGAVSWYINKHNLKLQADYTNIHKQEALAINSGPNATDDKRVRLQAQIIF